MKKSSEVNIFLKKLREEKDLKTSSIYDFLIECRYYMEKLEGHARTANRAINESLGQLDVAKKILAESEITK